jgi:hypothetical protein
MVFSVIQPSFELAVSPLTALVLKGQQANFNITIHTRGETDISVLLSIKGLPNETSYIFSENPITPSSSSQLTIIPSPLTPSGWYNVSIMGTSSIGTHSVNIGLEIMKDDGIVTSIPFYLYLTIPIIGALLILTIFYLKRIKKEEPPTQPSKKYYLEGLPLDSSTLMEMPDHLRKTALILCHTPESTADEIAQKTGRARAVESDYLNQLVTLGHIKKRRRGRRVYFYIERKGG